MDKQIAPTATQPPSGPDAPGGKPFGPVAAAFLAAGSGSVVLGILTTLAEVSAGFKEWLDFSTPVGPLSGKTTLAVIGYVASWAILAVVYKGKSPEPKKVFMWTASLVAIGLVMTFPLFFTAFAPEE